MRRLLCVFVQMFMVVLIAALPPHALATSLRKEKNAPGVELPDFRERKKRFIDYLTNFIHRENDRIRSLRRRLESTSKRLLTGKKVTTSERSWLETLAGKYRVELVAGEETAVFPELFHKIDTLPASLVLAQAAHESGWGTSRFAQEDHNLFGLRCFELDCGTAPRELNGSFHAAAKFDSTSEAIESYFLNLNSHPAYERLRTIRAELRRQGKRLSSLRLAAGLEGYSERGAAYIEDIRKMILTNDLMALDLPSGSANVVVISGP